MSISLTGSDTIQINGRVFADVADGDCAVLEFPNDMAVLKPGKNGNVLYALDESGRQANFTLRLIRGSEDDKFLNSLLVQQMANFAGFVLMDGEFVKRIGDGVGNIQADTYIVSGGIFQKQVEAKSNQEGDTDQSVSIYQMIFANAPRVLT